jgi:hypothetical protein
LSGELVGSSKIVNELLISILLPYKKYEKGGSKEGEDITNDPNWIKDKGWIEGATDSFMAWETSKRMIMDAFPEIFTGERKEDTQ